MKRRRSREQDEATAREQAEDRREALLAELKARLGAEPEPQPAPEPEPEPEPEPAPEPEPEPAGTPDDDAASR
jgi:hypothetical protein